MIGHGYDSLLHLRQLPLQQRCLDSARSLTCGVEHARNIPTRGATLSNKSLEFQDLSPFVATASLYPAV